MTVLTKKVLACQEKGEGFSDLVRELSLLVYRFPKAKHGWSEDDCSDFFCSFFNRIPGMIERFQYIGISFDTFFFTSIHWQMKTFLRKKQKHSAYDRVATESLYFMVQEAPETYWPYDASDIPRPIRRKLEINDEGIITDRASCIRILCMSLRNCEFIDDRMIGQISRLCGCTTNWLSACITHLRDRMHTKRAICNKLQIRRNIVFMRICLLHDELNLDLGGYKSDQIFFEIELEKTQLREITEQINHYPLYPSHKEIGQVLGIPKGTVDSGLYYLKDSLKGFCN